MKVGLLTSIREDHHFPGENFLKRYMTNLAPMYLAAYIQKQGIPVEVHIKEKLEDLENIRPEIIGISSVTENFEFAKQLAAKAKGHWNSISILGGVHLTSLPLTLPLEFDIGVIGEGEETICELLNAILRAGGLPKKEVLANIPGIVFHDENRVHRTSPRKGIQHLDDIPIPSREKFVKELGTTYLITSRGCPYTCNFCVIPNISEGYRTHSPEYVVDEIKSIIERFPHVQHMRIFDDLYIVDRRRVHRIAEMIYAEGLHQEVSFGCWGRGNLIDEGLMGTFRKMNMLYVAFGAESGSSRVLSKVKPGTSLEQNQLAIDRLYDNGIHVSCSVILGHPLETEDDLWATYEFIEKNLSKLLEIEFNVAIPWPGTDLWNYALQRNLVSEDMNFKVLKECAYFPNYCTDFYPYLNEKITPERFDVIMAEFKKLFAKMMKKMDNLHLGAVVNTPSVVAQLI